MPDTFTIETVAAGTLEVGDVLVNDDEGLATLHEITQIDRRGQLTVWVLHAPTGQHGRLDLFSCETMEVAR